eukprot:2720100-Pleurochrysis_carterae.AAC.1
MAHSQLHCLGENVLEKVVSDDLRLLPQQAVEHEHLLVIAQIDQVQRPDLLRRPGRFRVISMGV